MSNGGGNRYEVRWGHGTRLFPLKTFFTLEAARDEQEYICRVWADPGDTVAVVELSGFTTRTISEIVQTIPQTTHTGRAIEEGK